VERVKVTEDWNQPPDEAVRVFVLFTSELSALRGVNALDGRLFGGRKYVYLWSMLTVESKLASLMWINLKTVISGRR
jgi:hypothetical protein